MGMNYNPAPKPKINFNRSLGWNLTNRKDMEITERIFDGADCYRWRLYYAWLPVKTISGKYVWGKKIYKQRYWAVWGQSFHMESHVEYAELFDILNDA
jgi:hypothetical protein